MIPVIKRIFQVWFIKYWLVVILSFFVCGAGVFIVYKIEERTKHYSANILGSTLLLNYTSLFYYLEPLADHLHNGEFKEAAFIIGLKPEDIMKIKKIEINSVHEVAEETDVRYEFKIIVSLENDTIGLYKFEKSLISLIKKHPLIIHLNKNSEWVYQENVKLVQHDLFRIDSTLSMLNKENISGKEVFQKRKSELQSDLLKLQIIRDNTFDVKTIYGFKDAVFEIHPKTSKFFILWICISLTGSLLFILIKDKEVRNLIMDKLI